MATSARQLNVDVYYENPKFSVQDVILDCDGRNSEMPIGRQIVDDFNAAAKDADLVLDELAQMKDEAARAHKILNQIKDLFLQACSCGSGSFWAG
jgi:hypothetical protein